MISLVESGISKQKQIIFNLVLILLFILLSAFTYDYLKGSTSNGSGTTNSDGSWSNVTQVSIDVTNVNSVLVIAGIDMKNTNTSSNDDTEAHYRIDYNNGTSQSGELLRHLDGSTTDHGMGSVVHIFDVSNETNWLNFTLQHKNGLNYNSNSISSQAVLTAVALTTNITQKTLNFGQANLTSNVGVQSSTFSGISELTTSALTLPLTGDIYVAASISSRAQGPGPIGEWELQYSADNVTWTSVGLPIRRSMVNRIDEGMISLVGVAKDLGAGNYYLRVAHRNVNGTGTVYTLSGSTIVAVALNYNDGTDNCYFETFYQEDETGDENSSTNTYETVTGASITTPNSIGGESPDVFIHSQFGMLGSESLLSTYKFSSNAWSGVEQSRDVNNSTDKGSGVLIGLMENLGGNVSVSGVLEHKTNVGTLTTCSIVLTGFHLFNKEYPSPTPSPVELNSFTASNSEKGIMLNWQTATEVNNYGFQVERQNVTQIASNLSNQWEKIGFVEGHGNSNSINEYSFTDTDNLSGIVKYRLKQIDVDGGFEYSDVIEVASTLPKKYTLEQNYPNPFNPSTTIQYGLKTASDVQLTVYNVLGQEVVTLVKQHQKAGNYQVKFDASNLASGTYVYKINAISRNSATESFASVKKLLLMK